MTDESHFQWDYKELELYCLQNVNNIDFDYSLCPICDHLFHVQINV